MRHTQDELTQNLTERWCWEVAHRDDTRVARRWYRQQEVDGVYRLEEGPVLDEFFHCLAQIGVMAWRAEAHGTAIQREMVPYGPYVLLYGLKTLFGMERRNALPTLLCSDDARRPLVGCKAQHVRPGVCQLGAATRQGERTPGPISPETLANTIVQLNLQDLEFVCHGAIRAWAKAKVVGAKVTGSADGTDLETTARYTGYGQLTRQRRSKDRRGREQEIEITVYGWTELLLIEAATKLPLAVKVGTIQAPETPWTRAWITHARAHLAGVARRHKVVCTRRFWDGTALWWLDQQGLTCVVPAKDHIAMTAEARAQTVVEEESTVGRRVHSGRHEQGREARTERLETAVVGMTGLTTDDQNGPPEPGRHGNRRDFQANPIKAMVVRQWKGRDDGPAGKPVFLTNAPVDKPLQPFEDDDDCRLLEHCCIKAATQQGELGPPPQKTDRAVRVQILFTLRLFALATAYRLQCEREDMGGEPIGWQRWRRQLLEQTRALDIVCAQGSYGIFHLAEYSLLLGGKLKDVPPGIGTRQEILAKYRLTMCR